MQTSMYHQSMTNGFLLFGNTAADVFTTSSCMARGWKHIIWPANHYIHITQLNDLNIGPFVWMTSKSSSSLCLQLTMQDTTLPEMLNILMLVSLGNNDYPMPRPRQQVMQLMGMNHVDIGLISAVTRVILTHPMTPALYFTICVYHPKCIA